jgi:neutral trehalase
MFYDYDHHTGQYNRALTLYSFLPLWAGVDLKEEQADHIIRSYLINPEYFFGTCPFPYLAYNEEAYRPDGYWRGRVWPHVTLWMLEMLWDKGYRKEADMASDRLLAMMDQQKEILENYNSDMKMPGGGEPDYSWSFASYLALENRMYREPALWKAIGRNREGLYNREMVGGEDK